MKHSSHILDDKGHDVWFLAPDRTVYDAIEMMAEKGVGALLVMEDEQLVGIVNSSNGVELLFCD